MQRGARRRCPNPATRQAVRRRRRRRRSTSRSGPAATSSTSTSTAARSGASTTPPATRPPTAVATATPDERRRAAAPCTSTRPARATPTRRHAQLRLGPRRRRRVRRRHRPHSRRSPTPTPGTYTVGAPGHRRPTARSATDAVAITVGQHAADRHDRLAHRRAHLEGRRPDRLRGHRHRRAGRHPARRSALSWKLVAPPLPLQLPRAHRADLRPA